MTNRLGTPRSHHAAVAIGDDTILVIGGWNDDGNSLKKMEAVRLDTNDIANSQCWECGELELARHDATATLLPNGNTIVVAGGESKEGRRHGLRCCRLRWQ